MFNQQFTISIRDINYGQHLDHLSLLGYLHETRVRYLHALKCTENNIDGNGTSLIVSTLTCNYKKECFYGDRINVQMEILQESALRLMLKYTVTKDHEIVATAEIIVVFLNSNHKITKIPKNLINI